MNYYTSIEQSKELLEIGLDEMTADMFYLYIFPYEAHDESGWEGYDDHATGEPYCTYSRKKGDWKKSREDLPCWSLGALMDIMLNISDNSNKMIYYPKLIKGLDGKNWYVTYDLLHFTEWYENPVDAAVEMVKWLIKKNYIKAA